MGIFDDIKKVGKKVVGGVKKQVSKVAKIVKKSVKGVAKVVREVGRGVKKLTKNKYVRMGLMIAAAVTLPMFVPAIAALPAVAAGAVTGAITGGAGALLQGGDFKDVLKGAAFGSATGAAFAKIGEAIKTARGATDFKADTVGGKLDAMGADVPDIPVTDAAPTIDVSGDVVSRTVPQPDFQFDPTEVSKFSIDPNINPLDSLSPTGLTNTTNVAAEVITPAGNSISFDSTTGLWSDKTGVTFTQAQVDLGASKGVLAIKEGAPAYSVTKPVVDTSIAAPAASVKDSIQMSQNFAKYGSTDPTLGQKIAGGFKDAGERLKESFSPENIVDKGLEVGETLLVGAAQGAISERMADDQYVGDPAYAQQEYANQLQEVQRIYTEANINLNDAYSHMTFGSGDVNAVSNQLFSQPTIQVA
tara:strand:+ start:983 stop:2230 length:1248 start_codon:yes stop_codon:yes gene_type:complete